MSINKNRFILFGIVTGAVLGVIAGFSMGEGASVFAGLGVLFLNALKMGIVPLVFFSMVSGVGSLVGMREFGQFGIRTIIYYITTTFIAVLIGLTLVTTFTPGKRTEAVKIEGSGTYEREPVGVKERIDQIISPNIVESMAKMEILPVIIFSIILGLVLGMMGENGSSALVFFGVMNDAMMKIVDIVLWFSPFGVFGLIAGKIAQVGPENIIDQFTALAGYCLTVAAGLLIHGAIVLPGLYFIFTRKNPLLFVFGLSKALLTAFSTASSSATIPVTMECLEEELGVDKKTAGFVVPLGATINMDGTALYEAVAAVFIAQSLGVDLGTGELVAVFLVSTLAAIGAAGIPEAGLITLLLVLKAAGLPDEGVGLIIAVDWLLDRLRTTVNVLGDSVGAGILDSYKSARS